LCMVVSSASVLLAFLDRSGPDLRCVLSLWPQLHPACGSGSLWPFGVCPQLVSSACVLLAFVGRSRPCLGCPQYVSQLVCCLPFWVALALAWGESSACVLSLSPAGLCGSLWPLFGVCPQIIARATQKGKQDRRGHRLRTPQMRERTTQKAPKGPHLAKGQKINFAYSGSIRNRAILKGHKFLLFGIGRWMAQHDVI
jgi:hypothetical protein